MLQVVKKLLVPYNDPDAANCRLETVDDYVAFGAAATTAAGAGTPPLAPVDEEQQPPKMRSRGNGFLGNLVLKKSHAASGTKGDGGMERNEELYGFEPEALDFVLTMVCIYPVICIVVLLFNGGACFSLFRLVCVR